MPDQENYVVHALIAGDMSQASLTSAIVDILGYNCVGIQLVWTGTPVGTFAVQVSNDNAQAGEANTQRAGTWTPLTLSGALAAAGAAGSAYADLNSIGSRKLQVVYTKGSSTGVLDIWVTCKAQ